MSDGFADRQPDSMSPPKMTYLSDRDPLEEWFSSTDLRNAQGILQSAFETAKNSFTTELRLPDGQITWTEQFHTLQDLQDILKDARKRYESKPLSKAFTWLARFSTKVKYYGTILDVLSQHHPEYVSLAWGVFKLLFTAVVNHEDQITQLAKACTQVAEVLPRVELTLTLYKTERVKSAVNELYLVIIRFLWRAVKWYRKGKLSHTWTAIARPWELSFKEHIDNIDGVSRRIDQLASSASKAELRATHLEVHQVRAELKDVRLQVDRLVQMAHQSHTLQSQMQLSLESYKSSFARIELNQMLSLPFFSQLPTSGETMNFCRTFRDRRRQRFRLPALTISQLETWSKNKGCSFLFTESYNSQMSKDFLVNLVELIQQANLQTIWALRFEDYWTKHLTFIDLLKMLVLHSLQLNPASLTAGQYPITAAAVRDAVDETDWLKLLSRAFFGISTLYIVLDSEILAQMTQDSPYAATRLLEMFSRTLSSTFFKVVVSTRAIDERYIRRNWDLESWTKITILNPEGKRKLPDRRTYSAQQRFKRRRRV